MKKRRVTFIAILISMVFVILVGMTIYYHNVDKVEGRFFRKMYGSIGVVNDNDYCINMELFCFNRGMECFDEPEKLSFDNRNVIIKDVSYEEQSRDKDLTIFSVGFNVSFANTGRQDVTSLIYSGEKIVKYPIGKISFLYNDKDSVYFKHGCETIIRDNKAVFTFSESNSEPFVITDLKLAEDERISYEYKKNVSFMPGNELSYVLNVEYSGSEKDLLIVQPIFEIRLNGTNKSHYFTPNMLVYSGKTLTYLEIKEYIK